MIPKLSQAKRRWLCQIFDVKEKRFEEDIEDYLIHHGGYIKG